MRTIVKHSYIRSADRGFGRSRAHVRYLQHRPGRDLDESAQREFFNRESNDISYRHIFQQLNNQPGRGVMIHKLILSPGVPDADITEFTRHVMSDLCKRQGQLLDWYGVAHYNTDHPHAHVVIMGADLEGIGVRFDKGMYRRIREAGDAYLIKEGLLSRERERDRDHHFEFTRSGLFNRMLRIVRDASRAMLHRLRVPWLNEQKDQRIRDLVEGRQGDLDEKAFGQMPPPGLLLHRATKGSQRALTEDQRLWKQYSRPIHIKYDSNKTERTEFTWRSDLRSLRELERDYKAGDKDVLASMTEVDFARLQLWIKHRWQEDRRTEELSEKIRAFEVNFDDSDSMTVTPQSQIEKMEALLNLHEGSDIYLRDDEVGALRKWIARSRNQSPLTIYKDFNRAATIYDKKSPLRKLEKLAEAYRSGEDWARGNISKADFRKLESWIAESKRSTKSKDQRDQRSDPSSSRERDSSSSKETGGSKYES